MTVTEKEPKHRTVGAESFSLNKSEYAGIDYRRRFDQACAVRSYASELWPQIDALVRAIEEKKNSRWIKVWGAIAFTLL